jgi:phospholipase/carboxylesterase
VIRVRVPPGPGPHPAVLMLHGWTGDENSMFIFAQRLPKDAMLISPRALYPAPREGYSWQPQSRAIGGAQLQGSDENPQRGRFWPTLDDLRPAVAELRQLLVPGNFPTADLSRLRLVGFSQGAALSLASALLHPDWMRAVACMSGFMPKGVSPLLVERPLAGMPVFVTHGSQDDTVPVSEARAAVGMLEKAGAQVQYCEDDVGHKLSLTCFKSLEAFFKTT